jgi:hypothetical protein
MLKKLFCKHEYVYQFSQLFNTGMSKAVHYKCINCGKTKIKFV